MNYKSWKSWLLVACLLSPTVLWAAAMIWVSVNFDIERWYVFTQAWP
jgi:hypothetical protein